MKKIRILVVDDESVVREGVVAILSYQQDIEVIAEAKNGIEAVEAARKTKPDVILLDLVMPKQDGLATIPKLREIVPEARILVLTSFAESDRVYQTIKAGALGYLLKDATRASSPGVPARLTIRGSPATFPMDPPRAMSPCSRPPR